MEKDVVATQKLRALVDAATTFAALHAKLQEANKNPRHGYGSEFYRSAEYSALLRERNEAEHALTSAAKRYGYIQKKKRGAKDDSRTETSDGDIATTGR